jgi:hypothetical protein
MSGAMEQALRIFVISLARAQARRAAIVGHLRELGLRFEVVEGVDGAALPADEHDALLAPGVHFAHRGVVGCYMSHLLVHRRIVSENLAAALILEDDAALVPAVVPLLRAGLGGLAFDYCFLDCANDRPERPVFYDAEAGIGLGHGFKAYPLSAGPSGAHALIVSRAAAEQRLRHGVPIREPVDFYETLPGTPRFVALLHPAGAGVSTLSLRSQTSARAESLGPRFIALRRYAAFQCLRDWAKLRPVKGWAARRRMAAEGRLPAGGRWRMLPLGREVIWAPRTDGGAPDEWTGAIAIPPQDGRTHTP